MKLFFHKDWRGNFGDDLNNSFFDCIWPGFRNVTSKQKLYGIGTLLNAENGVIENSVIFGSGFGYGEKVIFDPNSCTIIGVRGPLTATAMGLPASYIIGDPALYLPRLPEFLIGKSLCLPGQIVVAPHHRTSELWDLSYSSDDKYYFLDAGVASVNDYIATIRSAKLVLTEAMHGAIVCCAFDVPFYPVNIRGLINPTKWKDFSSSINLNIGDFHNLHRPKSSILRLFEISRARPIFDFLNVTRRSGARISEGDDLLLKESISKVVESGKPLIADQTRIQTLQEKFGQAIENAKSIF